MVCRPRSSPALVVSVGVRAYKVSSDHVLGTSLPTNVAELQQAWPAPQRAESLQLEPCRAQGPKLCSRFQGVSFNASLGKPCLPSHPEASQGVRSSHLLPARASATSLDMEARPAASPTRGQGQEGDAPQKSHGINIFCRSFFLGDALRHLWHSTTEQAVSATATTCPEVGRPAWPLSSAFARPARRWPLRPWCQARCATRLVAASDDATYPARAHALVMEGL